jgi:hypothetical protein
MTSRTLLQVGIAKDWVPLSSQPHMVAMHAAFCFSVMTALHNRKGGQLEDDLASPAAIHQAGTVSQQVVPAIQSCQLATLNLRGVRQ